MGAFRKLTVDEIEQLKQQNCIADNWSDITVTSDFTPDHIYHTRFSGQIKLGAFKKDFSLAGGLKKHSGLRHVTLHNCEIGDDVLIENISNYIANYRIENGSFIQIVNLLIVEGKSRFGNGTEVSVLNETGGREVPIYDKLSAHLAYIIALYRHRPVLIEKLKKMIDAYSDEHASEMGTIGEHTTIINVGMIKNVRIGSYCTINGASRLENGSINSNEHDPVIIGHNVMAEDFIISSGAHVNDGVVMMRCLFNTQGKN